MSGELLDGTTEYSELKNICVWVKTTRAWGASIDPSMSSYSYSKTAQRATSTNVELGRFGRSRSNVWTHAGRQCLWALNAMNNSPWHPTVQAIGTRVRGYPRLLETRRHCPGRLFAGSGTTLIAAEKTGRRGYGMEIDPHYVDTIVRRFAKVYGLEAIHAESGKTFQELSAERSPNEGPRHVKSQKVSAPKRRKTKAISRARPTAEGR